MKYQTYQQKASVLERALDIAVRTYIQDAIIIPSGDTNAYAKTFDNLKSDIMKKALASFEE